MSARTEEVTINSWDELRPGDAYVRPGPGFSRIVRREAPEVEPGTVGTATVEDGSRQHGFLAGGPGRERFLYPGPWINGYAITTRHTDFVPDPDTAALRAEVAEAERLAALRLTNLDRQKARADAAEARLARLTPDSVDAALAPYFEGWKVTRAGAARAVLALVAAEESVRKAHDLSCDLATSPCADCLQQAHHG